MRKLIIVIILLFIIKSLLGASTSPEIKTKKSTSGNVVIQNNTISTTTGGVTISPYDGTASVSGHLIPGTDNNKQLGSLTNRWGSLHVGTITSTNSPNWDTSYAWLTAGRNNWDTSYLWLTAGRANWDQSYSWLTAGRANWDTSYSWVNAGRSNWDQSYSWLTVGRSNWDTAYSKRVDAWTAPLRYSGQTASIDSASTSQLGAVQLSNLYNGTSQVLATTEKALSDGLATKQNTLTNPITGTGTSNQLAYFNGTTSITSSANLIYNGTNFGVFNSSPTEVLSVKGSSGNPNGVARLDPYNSNAFTRFIGFDSTGNYYTQIFQGSSGTSGTFAGLNHTNNSFLKLNPATAAAIGTVNSTPLTIATNNTSAITIDNSQKVGIGTTSPGEILHLKGQASVSNGSPIIAFEQSGSTNKSYLGQGSASGGQLITGMGADDLGIRYYDELYIGKATTPVALFTTSGQLGVGATALDADSIIHGKKANANTYLVLEGGTGQEGIRFQDSTGGANSWYIYKDTSATLRFYNNTLNKDVLTFSTSGTASLLASAYKDSGSNTVTVKAPTTVAASYLMSWPTSQTVGTLANDGSGNLYWSTATALTKADQNLGNLTTTSINESLIPADATKNIGSAANPWGTGYFTSSVQVGHGTSTTAGTVRFNTSTLSLDVADGTDYQSVTNPYSKSNLKNGGFEYDLQDWVTTGKGAATVTVVDGTNAGFEAKALSIDFTTSSQYVETEAITVPNALIGQPCEASYYSKGWNSGGTVAVYDGTSGLVAYSSRTFQTGDTNWSEHIINYPCPSQGQMKLRFTSGAGNDSIVYLDNVYLGRQIKTEPVYLSAYKSTNSDGAANTWYTAVFDIKESETTHPTAINTSTGTITIPVDGIYSIKSYLALYSDYVAGYGLTYGFHKAYVNGAQQVCPSAMISALGSETASCILNKKLNAGDTIYFRWNVYVQNTFVRLYGGQSLTRFEISRVR